jgi:hypothetical protein
LNNHFEQWSKLAPLGLLMIGAGASLLGHAAFRKGVGKSWFWEGSAGLMVLNAGVSVFGDAVKHRALYELKTDS